MRQRKFDAYLHGAAISMSWADPTRSLTDLIFDGVSAALADAHTQMEQIDSVVLAAHDIVDGRSLSSMVTAPAAGAYLRDEIRLAEDGLVAASLAAARIESGEADLSIVAAWARASEGDLDATARTSFDPFFAQPFHVSESEMSALRLSAWLGRHGAHAQEKAEAAGIRDARARANPRGIHHPTREARMSYPSNMAEGPRWADIVVAAVIGKEKRPVRIAGIGHSTDMPAIGDRNLLTMPALSKAFELAQIDASIAKDAIDIFEIEGMTLSDEAIAFEALGIANAGEGFKAYARDGINRSGGSASGWCYPAMGLVRMAEAYIRLRESPGKSGKGRTALATGNSPIAAQTSTAMILEAA